MQNHSVTQELKKPSESVTIEHARQTRTAKKRELMQQLLETFQTKPNATLSELAHIIGRSKSPIGGYLSELEASGFIRKSEPGWSVFQSPGD